MTRYIDIAILVAEIKRIEHETNYEPFTDEVLGKRCTCRSLLSFLDSIGTKEVDYGIEVHKYAQEHFNVYDDVNKTLQTKENKTLLGRKDFEDIAKYFFELGLKAQKGE